MDVLAVGLAEFVELAIGILGVDDRGSWSLQSSQS